MQATDKFSMRVTPEDRENFAELKRLFKRPSQSDAIRHVVRETPKHLVNWKIQNKVKRPEAANRNERPAVRAAGQVENSQTLSE